MSTKRRRKSPEEFPREAGKNIWITAIDTTFFLLEIGKHKKLLDKEDKIVYHQPNITNAMTGKTSLRAFQRAVGCCETVCRQLIYWPSSSQLKVRKDRRWDRDSSPLSMRQHSPARADVESGYFYINKSGTAEGSFRLLWETEAFFYFSTDRQTQISRRTPA